MMMRMLEAVGMEVLTDEHLKPGIHNPNGYYEHTGVYRLKDNPSWIKCAEGKAVKVLSNHLPYLPDVPCKIVFMERDHHERIDSWNKMGRRIPHESVPFYVAHVEAVKESLKGRDVVYVDYNAVLRDPVSGLLEAAEFLGVSVLGMVKVVDPKLYRNRKNG